MPPTPPNAIYSKKPKRARPVEGGQRRVVWIAIAVVTVVAVAAVIAIVATSGGSGTPKNVTLLQVQPVRISGPALPVPEAGAPDNAVGKSIPTIDGKTFGSRSIAIKPGKPTLIVVINRSDTDVEGEVKTIVQWHHGGNVPKSLNVVTLITGPGRATASTPVSSWLVDEEWPFPVLIDDANSSAAAALGVPVTPAVLLVDPTGTVKMRVIGAIPAEQLAQQISAQLGI